MDDSVNDPTVTFNQKDIERSSSENEYYSDQDEVIKKKYMHIAHRTTDNDDDSTANEIGHGMVIIEEVDHEEVVTQETNASTWKKRVKRGKADEEEWEKNRNKRQRMQGEKYLGLKKTQDGTYSYSVERGKHQVAPRNCSKRCKNCPLFTEKEREDIFSRFWNNMNWEQRKVFVSAMVDKFDVKQRKDKDSRRRNSCRYFLEKDGQRTQVCKRMFIATLALGERTIYEWLKGKSGIPEKPG